MSFILPNLPYDKKALSPIVSEETFNFHHGKHHATYIDKLNSAIKDTGFVNLDLEDIIVRSAKEQNLPVFNNAAQHWNHSFFWNCLSPDGGKKPAGEIAKLIDRDFGSFDVFKEKFSSAATGLFGSGWTWLVLNQSGKLEIVSLSNAGTPLVEGKKALLTLDVWEHAYYIDYRNARPKFIEGFWEIVNWKHANLLL